MNNDILIQISWMHVDNDLEQQLRIYNKKNELIIFNEQTSYSLAIERFNSAEPYGDINISNW